MTFRISKYVCKYMSTCKYIFNNSYGHTYKHMRNYLWHISMVCQFLTFFAKSFAAGITCYLYINAYITPLSTFLCTISPSGWLNFMHTTNRWLVAHSGRQGCLRYELRHTYIPYIDVNFRPDVSIVIAYDDQQSLGVCHVEWLGSV